MKADIPARPGGRDLQIERRPSGEIILQNAEPLENYPERFTAMLEHWATLDPDRPYLAERDGQDWNRLSYAQVLARVESVGQALLDRGLGAETPILILSANSLDYALMALAAMHVGVPYSPVSTGYALLTTDYARLEHAWRTLGPGLVFTNDADVFGAALDATVPAGIEIVATRGTIPGRSVTPMQDLLATPVTPDVAAAKARVTADTVAKILFTSGSSSMPKGVINTNRMISANQRMHGQAWRFLDETPPVILDWAPWNHTLGANTVFGLPLFFGGTLYIDDGKPTPDGIARMAENIADVRPTVFFGVPVVYQLLLPLLARDAALRHGFFARLQMIFYAGANLPRPAWEELQRLIAAECETPPLVTAALGATETAPTLLTCSWNAGKQGILGLPVAGVTLKLTPFGDLYEVRVKGPSITPGYWRDPSATAKAYDADGWYCMGDAVRFDDPAHPEMGLVYDGRLSENFKLATGTWVVVAPLRSSAIEAFAPLVADVVITGHSETEVGLVIFPILKACRDLPGCENAETHDDLLALPAFRAAIQQRLDALNRQGNSSTTRVTRISVISADPTGIELTDKKTLSFAAVLNSRKAEVAALYRGETGPQFFYAQSGRASVEGGQ